MCIQRRVSAAVVDDRRLTVAATPPRRDHLAGFRCEVRVPFRAPDVDARVEAAPAWTVGGVDAVAHGRPCEAAAAGSSVVTSRPRVDEPLDRSCVLLK